jgi:hypothetical protein
VELFALSWLPLERRGRSTWGTEEDDDDEEEEATKGVDSLSLLPGWCKGCSPSLSTTDDEGAEKDEELEEEGEDDDKVEEEEEVNEEAEDVEAETGC